MFTAGLLLSARGDKQQPTTYFSICVVIRFKKKSVLKLLDRTVYIQQQAFTSQKTSISWGRHMHFF